MFPTNVDDFAQALDQSIGFLFRLAGARVVAAPEVEPGLCTEGHRTSHGGG